MDKRVFKRIKAVVMLTCILALCSLLACCAKQKIRTIVFGFFYQSTTLRSIIRFITRMRAYHHNAVVYIINSKNCISSNRSGRFYTRHAVMIYGLRR